MAQPASNLESPTLGIWIRRGPSCLDVVVGTDDFSFEVPKGQPASLGEATVLDKLTGQRFPLSQRMRKQIAADVKLQETSSGYLYWLCFGCAGSTFDWDRDVVALRREVLQAVASRSPLREGSDFRLLERIEEGSWRTGRVVLQLELLAPPTPDPQVDQQQPFTYANPLPI
eukprot:scaffold25.g5107.t1